MNETIARYEKMVEQFPQNELARFSLERKPDWMVVQILIGKSEMALGNKAGAKEAFENALQLAIAQHHEGPQMEMEQALADLA